VTKFLSSVLTVKQWLWPRCLRWYSAYGSLIILLSLVLIIFAKFRRGPLYGGVEYKLFAVFCQNLSKCNLCSLSVKFMLAAAAQVPPRVSQCFFRVKNYPALKFMLSAAAAETGVPYAFSPWKTLPLKIYCRYIDSKFRKMQHTVCAADARSVCDS